MHEHDAHRLTLLVVGRRLQQRKIEADREAEHGGEREPRQHALAEAAEARRGGEEMEGGHFCPVWVPGGFLSIRQPAARRRPWPTAWWPGPPAPRPRGWRYGPKGLRPSSGFRWRRRRRSGSARRAAGRAGPAKRRHGG